MIDQRKQRLLKCVTEAYIETAEPVGSRFLVNQQALGVSGATIRNEMRALEHEGLLTHPHTSAGRIPTAAGYQFYVEHLLDVQSLTQNLQKRIGEILDSDEVGARARKLARLVADELRTAVIISFAGKSFFYTGLTHLFSQPEFTDARHTVEISSIFDHCDAHVPRVSKMIHDRDIHVFIGNDNPLGSKCSVAAARIGGESLFMVLGPLRMRYSESVALLTHIKEVIS
jgi:heat-inducible transcriptional repressor